MSSPQSQLRKAQDHIQRLANHPQKLESGITLVKKATDHNLSASSGGQDNNRTYAQAAVPQLVKNLLRDHRTILIPKGKGLLQIRPDENKNNTQTNMLTVNLLPEKTVRQSTLTGIANDIAFSNGVFYSYSP
jgi:hypothetical protein